MLVIGVGNELRHDDAAGLEVARRTRALAARAPRAPGAPPIGIREHEGETLALLGAWEGADTVVLVDAMHGRLPVGAIERFDASAGALPARMEGSTSTHAIGVGEAIELARVLGRLPRLLVVYGVAGARFDSGSGLSPAVREVIGPLARRVLDEASTLAVRQG